MSLWKKKNLLVLKCLLLQDFEIDCVRINIYKFYIGCFLDTEYYNLKITYYIKILMLNDVSEFGLTVFMKQLCLCNDLIIVLG